MTRTRMILAMILTYMIFAMLLNSVGTVILQSIQGFGISKADASLLEAFKDLPIAITSFLVASFLPRLGYRRAMMLGLLLVAAACVAMPLLQAFWATKLLFATVGVAFALVKVSVYSSIGLLTGDAKAHAALTSTVSPGSIRKRHRRSIACVPEPVSMIWSGVASTPCSAIRRASRCRSVIAPSGLP